MEKIICVTGQNGLQYDVLMTEEQIAFFLRVLKQEADAGRETTFDDLVIQEIMSALKNAQWDPRCEVTPLNR